MDCICVMTSYIITSSFWLALSGHSAMALSWSLQCPDVPNEVLSLKRLHAALPFLTARIWPTVVGPTKSSDHHVVRWEVHPRAAHSQELCPQAILYVDTIARSWHVGLDVCKCLSMGPCHTVFSKDVWQLVVMREGLVQKFYFCRICLENRAKKKKLWFVFHYTLLIIKLSFASYPYPIFEHITVPFEPLPAGPLISPMA